MRASLPLVKPRAAARLGGGSACPSKRTTTASGESSRTRCAGYWYVQLTHVEDVRVDPVFVRWPRQTDARKDECVVLSQRIVCFAASGPVAGSVWSGTRNRQQKRVPVHLTARILLTHQTPRSCRTSYTLSLLCPQVQQNGQSCKCVTLSPTDCVT